MKSRIARLLVLPVLWVGSVAHGQTSYPMVTRVQPTALQRGQSAEVTISGNQNFAGASSLLFEGLGLSGSIIDTPKEAQPKEKGGRRSRRAGASVQAKITVAPDAALGPREVRVVTAQGVSSVGMVVIVNDPVTAEDDDKKNDEPKGAQALELPRVVSGAIGKVEDVDWYSFHAESGQQLTFSLWGNRLENKIHDLQEHLDPILVLYDAQGRELATDDNHDFADPLLSHTFKEAGTYLLQVRDTTYAGNPNWVYVLQITPRPFATAVFPMAVRPGTTAEVRAEGFNLNESNPISVPVPADTPLGPMTLPLSVGGALTPPTWFVATDLPVDQEANDAAMEPVRGQTLAIPGALSGRLGERNDVDAYLFEAKKGHPYTFEVLARRVGSNADPVLRLTDVKGKLLGTADDTFGKDPRLDWIAPADGLYALSVTDLHSRGGRGFGYVLQGRESKLDFTIACDPDKINIGPGARTAVFVRIERRMAYKEPVTVAWEGLPPGLSVSPLTIPSHMSQGVVVFTAAPDAKPAGALITLSGSGMTPDGLIVRKAAPQQEIYMPGGGRALYGVATLAAAITDPSDITVDASPSELTIPPGKTATIEVTVKRRPDFDKPVNLALDLAHLGTIYASALPPGVVMREGESKTLLDGKTTTGKIVLEAKPDAPASDKVPIAVMGHVSINFVVKTAYSSAPILISVPGPPPKK